MKTEIDELRVELARVRAEADTRHSEEWVAELEAHFAEKERELARVRAERDRLAQWIYCPDGEPDDIDVIDLMTVGPRPVGTLAESLAEHDRRAKEKPDEG